MTKRVFIISDISSLNVWGPVGWTGDLSETLRFETYDQAQSGQSRSSRARGAR